LSSLTAVLTALKLSCTGYLEEIKRKRLSEGIKNGLFPKKTLKNENYTLKIMIF